MATAVKGDDASRPETAAAALTETAVAALTETAVAALTENYSRQPLAPC